MFASVMFFPTWVTLLLAALGITYLQAYVAVVALAFLYDALYFGGTIHDGAKVVMLVPLSVYLLLASLLALTVRSRLREEKI